VSSSAEMNIVDLIIKIVVLLVVALAVVVLIIIIVKVVEAQLPYCIIKFKNR
jgi:hypothetical protein